MNILGLNAFHGDAAAALVKDGELVAAVEEERFRRIKHWAGFPNQAIQACLAEAGVTLADVDYIAINQDNRANRLRKAAYLLGHRPSSRLIADRLKNRRARKSLRDHIEEAFPRSGFRGQLVPVEHHMAHLVSAYYVSPFQDAAVVSVDGFGDFSSAAWGMGRGEKITVDERVFFPHSLGIFYQALTQYLGFPHYGDEYKVMGLAPYGRPTRLDAMRKIVALKPDGGFALNLNYFRHHREKVDYTWTGGSPVVGDLFSEALEDLLGPRRDPSIPLSDEHRDIARSAQAMYEEAFFHLLAQLHRRHGCEAVAVADGCGANSVANGKIRRETPYGRVFVQAAAGDAGGAIGAAFAQWRKTGGARKFVMRHAYWGPQFEQAEMSAMLADQQAALPRPAAPSSGSPTRPSFAAAPRRRSRKARSSAGSRGGWSGDRARSAIARSSAIRAAPI